MPAALRMSGSRSCFGRPMRRHFKRYSQMKLQMKREALAKLNRHANDGGSSFGTAQGQSGPGWHSRGKGTAKAIERGSNNFFGISSCEVWSGREDLNLRPPAPKAGALPGCATPRHFQLYPKFFTVLKRNAAQETCLCVQ